MEQGQKAKAAVQARAEGKVEAAAVEAVASAQAPAETVSVLNVGKECPTSWAFPVLI